MFVLNFFTVVRYVLDLTGAPEVYFHNQHESILEHKKNKHKNSDFFGMEPNQILLFYVAETYPLYFGMRDLTILGDSVKYMHY